MAVVDLELPEKVSYSQVNQYVTCGEQFKLERLYHLPRQPAWWFIGGNAFHSMVEMYELGDLADWEGRDALRSIAWEVITHHVKEALVDTDYTVDDIQARNPGNWSKDNKLTYPKGENEAWWLDNLPIMVSKYIQWRKVNRWALWEIPNHGPAIEVPVETEVGGFVVRGFIDSVMSTGGSIDLVIDTKSGVWTPQSYRQLGYMAEMLDRQYGINVTHGAYYSARKDADKVLGNPVDLTRWRNRFDEDVLTFRKGIEAGVFLPNESNLCNNCGVKDWCSVKGTKTPVLMEARDGSK